MSINRDIMGGAAINDGDVGSSSPPLQPYKVPNQQAAIVAIGGTTPAADMVPYFNSATTAALTAFTSFGRAFVGATSVAAQLIMLGLGNVNNTADAVKAVLSATKLTTARKIDGVSFDGTADIYGGAIGSKTATFTVAANEYTLLCDATSGAIVANLPAAASNNGRILNIKKIDASANTVTLDANASETIDGALTKVIAAQWTTVTVQCNGTGWFII